MDSRLAPKILSNFQRRKSSYFAFDPSDPRRKSIESLYSSLCSASISVSGGSSSADSVDIDRIQTKNRELLELVTSRLTAFLYFENFNKDSSSEDIASVKKSLEKFQTSFLQEMKDQKADQESIIIVTRIFKDLSEVYKEYKKELEILETNKKQLVLAENEELELNERLSALENRIHKMKLENEEKTVNCGCEII